MKDYNRRTPFNKHPKPPSKSSPFMPRSGISTHSIQTGITNWTPDKEDFNFPSAPHMAESSSSRQCYSNTRTSGRSQPGSRQSQVIDQNRLSSGFSRPLVHGEYSEVSTPEGIQPRKPYANVNLTNSANNARKPNPEARVLQPLARTGQLNSIQPPNALNERHGDVTSRSILSTYDQTRPPGESSSRARSSALSKEASQQSEPCFVDYGMSTAPEPTALSVIPSQPKGPQYPVPSIVPNLPSGRDAVIRTEPSLLSSQHVARTAVPQTAGVKRRLGMGRMTTSYSNKRFKHPG